MHILQVPLVLLINGYLAWRLHQKYRNSPEDPNCYGPLILHITGTCMVLAQPIFDSPGGILYDIRNGMESGRIEPPKLTQGGFWHHGAFMAFFQVTGLVCIAFASLWSAGVFKKLHQGLIKDTEDKDYGTYETSAEQTGV